MLNLDKKEERLKKEKQQWQETKKYLTQKRQLEKDKQQFFNIHFPSTSKLLTFFLFLNCTAIELFTGWVTMQNIEIARQTMTSPDLSPLITLIGAVVGETIGFAIYSLKAMKENCQGGIVYEQAFLKNQQEEIKEDIEDMDEEPVG